ncbi:hypothetical protein [Tissierella sp. Yu-01]|uniref:hypothetical protein n=1 Tax=Tissierella sp. Yu-01 TaxID=3035694 RepID=UPI00321AC09F
MVGKNTFCPVCREEGEHVKNITVKHMVNDKVKKHVGHNDYYLCMNEVCSVVYYSQESDNRFDKNDAVVNKGAKKMKDIIVLTGAMKNGKCETNNPLGKCCSPIIQEAIKKV